MCMTNFVQKAAWPIENIDCLYVRTYFVIDSRRYTHVCDRAHAPLDNGILFAIISMNMVAT